MQHKAHDAVVTDSKVIDEMLENMPDDRAAVRMLDACGTACGCLKALKRRSVHTSPRNCPAHGRAPHGGLRELIQQLRARHMDALSSMEAFIFVELPAFSEQRVGKRLGRAANGRYAVGSDMYFDVVVVMARGDRLVLEAHEMDGKDHSFSNAMARDRKKDRCTPYELQRWTV
jgi:hypothetical protein